MPSQIVISSEDVRSLDRINQNVNQNEISKRPIQTINTSSHVSSQPPDVRVKSPKNTKKLILASHHNAQSMVVAEGNTKYDISRMKNANPQLNQTPNGGNTLSTL
jgi:hypothetical protein